MRRRIAGLACLLAGTTGCAGPRPEPPAAAAVTAPAAWHAMADGQGDGQAGGQAGGRDPAPDWWRGFGDPTLTVLLRRALEHNADVGAAEARIRQAEAVVRLDRAAELPQVGGIATGTPRARLFGPLGEPLSFSGFFVGPAAAWDLDLFGRLAQLTAAARARLRGSRAAADAVRLGVVVQTVEGYATLLADRAALGIARDTVATFQAEADRRAHQARAGYATSLVADQAASQLDRAAAQVPPAVVAVEEDQDRLSVLVGENPEPVAENGSLFALVLPAAPGTVPARLLGRRPDLEAAAEEVVADDHQLNSARAAFLPDITLSASGGQIGADVLEHAFGVYSLSGSVLAPIFQGGALQANQALQAATRDEAAFAYRRAALNAFAEVEDALAQVDQSANRETAEREARDADARTLDRARQRFARGEADYFEVIDGERQLLAAQELLVQARAARLAALAALYGAMGGGWGTPERVAAAAAGPRASHRAGPDACSPGSASGRARDGDCGGT